MISLTPQERRVILFLVSVALVGLCINFAVKLNPPLKKVLQADERITKININQVSLDDLLSIQAITPKLAKSIIEYRNSKGAFRDIRELKEIKGIGDYRYDKLKDLFYIE